MIRETMAEELIVSSEVELTEADFAATLRHLPELRARWLMPVLMVVMVPVAVLVNHGSVGLATALPLGFMLLIFGFFQRSIGKSWPKRALADLGAGPTSFRFDDFGFSSSSSTRQHRLAWSALARYVETPQAFVVYTTPRTVLVVPKRAFEVSQLGQLSALLKARVTLKPPPSAGPALKRMLLLWLALIVMFVAIWIFLNQGAATR